MVPGGPLVYGAWSHAPMASTFSIADITANVAVLTNSPTFTSSTRVTTAQVAYWITQAVQGWSALVRQHFPEDRDFIQVASLPNLPGYAMISLPVNCGEVHAVLWQRADGKYEPLISASEGDIAATLEAGQGWENCGELPRYRIEGQTIAIYPPSHDDETIELFYTTHLSSGSTVTTRLDFDRWVAFFVGELVATAKTNQAKASDMASKRALLENDLLSRARQVDQNKTHTIRDVRNERIGAAMRARWGY